MRGCLCVNVSSYCCLFTRFIQLQMQKKYIYIEDTIRNKHIDEMLFVIRVKLYKSFAAATTATDAFYAYKHMHDPYTAEHRFLTLLLELHYLVQMEKEEYELKKYI